MSFYVLHQRTQWYMCVSNNLLAIFLPSSKINLDKSIGAHKPLSLPTSHLHVVRATRSTVMAKFA